MMKRSPSIVVALLLGWIALQPAVAQVSSPLNLVKQAVTAEGGVDALRKIKGLTLKGHVRHWEPEETYVADGDPKAVDRSSFTTVWDVEKRMARTEWDRAIEFPFPGRRRYTEIVTPKLGLVEVTETNTPVVQADIPTKGVKPMSGIRAAATLRELERVAPTLLLKALDAPQKLSATPDQTLGGGLFAGAFGGIFPKRTLPAVAFDDGGIKFIILFDRATHLPAAIRTIDDDAMLGDANYDVTFADWRPAGGIQIARSLTYTLDNIGVGKAVYDEVEVNPSIPAETFAVPDAIKAAVKPPATGDTPYQWVLRRQNMGVFLDNDAVNFPPGGGLRLVELAPNVQHVVGGSHNSLIVAMKDYLVVFDAPINKWQAKWTIDAAKAKYPGKPVKYLVLTHHHVDHAAGARTFVAAGATIIVPRPDKAYFEKVFKAPHTVVPDELQKHPRQATIIEVAKRLSLKDGGDEIRLYNVPNPHSLGMLVGYVVKEDIVWVTDLYSPARDKRPTPASTTLFATLQQLGLKPARFAGGHGGSSSYAEYAAIVGQR